jgi:hypothetical protein
MSIIRRIINIILSFFRNHTNIGMIDDEIIKLCKEIEKINELDSSNDKHNGSNDMHNDCIMNNDCEINSKKRKKLHYDYEKRETLNQLESCIPIGIPPKSPVKSILKKSSSSFKLNRSICSEHSEPVYYKISDMPDPRLTNNVAYSTKIACLACWKPLNTSDVICMYDDHSFCEKCNTTLCVSKH